MKLLTPISAIMTYNLVKLNITDDLTKAEHLFKKNKIRHIPVVKGEVIVGMISYSDLLKVSYVDGSMDENESVDVMVYNMYTIEQVMTKNLVTVSPSTTIKKAAEILAKGDFHALPVVERNRLIGIVTTTDMIKFLIEEY
ncbi:MAG: CBS domain-containing protein [Flavobacteriales bacterium]|nr:CBS domain-containing protein [Flavobacteriales bacterium]